MSVKYRNYIVDGDDRYWYLRPSSFVNDLRELVPPIYLPGVARVVGFRDVLPHLKLDDHFKPEPPNIPDSWVLTGTCPIPCWGITNHKERLRKNGSLPHLTLKGHLYIVCGGEAHIELDQFQRYYCDCLAPCKSASRIDSCGCLIKQGYCRPLNVVRFVQLITGIRDWRTLRVWFAKRFGKQIFAGDGIKGVHSFRGRRLRPAADETQG